MDKDYPLIEVMVESDYWRCFSCNRPKAFALGLVIDTEQSTCPNIKEIAAIWHKRLGITDDNSEEAKAIYAETIKWARTHACEFYRTEVDA